MEKTYQQITGTKIPVQKCSGILPNRMQCYRAGDMQVTATEEVEKDGKKILNTVIYQLCTRHAIIEQQMDKLSADSVALAENTKPVRAVHPQHAAPATVPPAPAKKTA